MDHMFWDLIVSGWELIKNMGTTWTLKHLFLLLGLLFLIPFMAFCFYMTLFILFIQAGLVWEYLSTW